MTHVQHEAKRIVPVHEARLKTLYPSRSFDDGLAIIEIALADRDASRLA
jgi:N-acyl homoserine lactone hydrolase